MKTIKLYDLEKLQDNLRRNRYKTRLESHALLVAVSFFKRPCVASIRSNFDGTLLVRAPSEYIAGRILEGVKDLPEVYVHEVEERRQIPLIEKGLTALLNKVSKYS